MRQVAVQTQQLLRMTAPFLSVLSASVVYQQTPLQSPLLTFCSSKPKQKLNLYLKKHIHLERIILDSAKLKGFEIRTY